MIKKDLFDNKINLEPRLNEYLEKKKYYLENDIDEAIPLEIQYSISDRDKKIIKSYMRGNMYPETKKSRQGDFVDPTGQTFPSSKFSDDPRYERLKTKMARDRDAQRQRSNYGIVSNNYDLFRNNNMASAVGNDRFGMYNMDDLHEEIHRKPQNQNNYFLMDSRDFVDNPNLLRERKRNTTYNNPPKIQYNERLRPSRPDTNQRRSNNNYENDINKIIGNLDTYQKRYTTEKNNYNFSSDMDLDTKVVIPNVNARRTSYENNYTAVPFMTGNSRDVDMETYIKYGTPSRGSKSVGYDNPFEHQFQFISDDIQDSRHVVMDRGTATRLYNKDIIKKKKRDVF